MADHSGNREAFQLAGGVAPMLGLLKTGDPHAQENATTALWNAMANNDDAKADLIKHQGMPLLIQQLLTGTPVGQELAAGAIWKSCANDPSTKDDVRQAIPGLVKLLTSGTTAAKEQAAGALRSACINSGPNKRELNRVNGIAALVDCMKTGTLRAREQAGAALANACVNSLENQTASRHAGAMQVLVQMIKDRSQLNLVECAVAGIRNVCVNSPENQEELNRCGGIQPLLMLLMNHRETNPALLEYTVGALWKACTHCEANRVQVLSYGIQAIESISKDETLATEIRRCSEGLLGRLNEHQDITAQQLAKAANDMPTPPIVVNVTHQTMLEKSGSTDNGTEASAVAEGEEDADAGLQETPSIQAEENAALSLP
mmetsp:Transcript_17653/g.27310  ORF Transcript_17653/g.27310 Transcript_17653/m.27310 type:complete len:374 (+) Transcript_17653:293-1414(+)